LRSFAAKVFQAVENDREKFTGPLIRCLNDDALVLWGVSRWYRTRCPKKEFFAIV